MFGYETISPIVLGRKQLKSRSVGYARERRGSQHFNTDTLERPDNSQAEAARLCRVIVSHAADGIYYDLNDDIFCH